MMTITYASRVLHSAALVLLTFAAATRACPRVDIASLPSADCDAAPPLLSEVRSPPEALTDSDVLHYALDLEVSSLNTGANHCTITGTNAITIRSKSPALAQFTIRLHSNYTITSLSVTDGPNTIPVSASATSSTTRLITLNRPYAMDEEFLLTIGYTGTSFSLDDSIDVQTQGGTPITYTLSEPFGEYTWWPAKDGDVGQPGDNSDKATFEMTVTAPNNCVIPSNGVLLGVDSLSGNRSRYRWATNYPITPYLVSFAATNYHTWTATYNYPAGADYPSGSMPVQFFIFPGSDTPNNRALWENSLNMIATYRTIYGEYPFLNEKYGIYQFNYGGGMEHQTMTGQGGFGDSLTAHELSHQWWGDMITCKTWGDVWLNEGFATYSECLWMERKTGTINTSAYIAAINARKPRSGGANGSVYCYNTSSLNTIFNSDYSYNKGAWVLHMLRHVVGDTTFFNILAAYRAQFAYGAATTDDFAGVASAVSGLDLSGFFNQYVYQRGAPIYQYGWQSVNVAGQDYLLANINQTQTATTGAPPQVLSVYQMPVDLQATIAGSPQIKKVQDTARSQWFVVPVSGAVTALSFDPGPFILRGVTTNVAYAPGPPKIVSTLPPPGDSIIQSQSPSQISVTFHTPVNSLATDFSLAGQAGGPQAVSLISNPGDNPVVLGLAGPLPPDSYTLTAHASISAMNSGMNLDGELTDPSSPASLPSGDGVAGGDAVIQFSVIACNSPGDIDANCVRDAIDVSILTDVLLGIDADPGHLARADLDQSGQVDGQDIGVFVSFFVGG